MRVLSSFGDTWRIGSLKEALASNVSVYPCGGSLSDPLSLFTKGDGDKDGHLELLR